ncbi:MAG: hypothetical protein R8M38_08765, partial [Mariprofundaceae bacterium]
KSHGKQVKNYVSYCYIRKKCGTEIAKIFRKIHASLIKILLLKTVKLQLSLGNPLLVLMLVIPGLFLHSLWRAICSSRGRDVSFSQRLIEKVESGEIQDINVFTEFKRFQDTQSGYELGDWRLNKDQVFINMQVSETRVKMDKHLPNTYAALWFLVIAIFVYQQFKDCAS